MALTLLFSRARAPSKPTTSRDAYPPCKGQRDHANGSRKPTQRMVALNQSALVEVLHALKAAEIDDCIRQAAQTVYQALMEAELTAAIGCWPVTNTSPSQRVASIAAASQPCLPS